MVPVVSIVGRSNSGKTTYLEKLISELKNRGYRVATIKHAAHGFAIDKPGKDTWRHAQAGADIVAISGPEKVAFIEKRERELTLDEIVSRISGVDIIITEGYKREKKPKIEVFRSEAQLELVSPAEELLAIAGDIIIEHPAPCFHIDDYRSIANVIEDFIKKNRKD